MCIIIYCPSGKQIPKENLENAFDYNSDGAGVMYYDKKGNVHYTKGFKRFDKLYDFWKTLDVSLPRAVHCRIATSGRISTKTCHPFPITKNVEDMGKAEGIAKNGCLMHNGIFRNYTPAQGMACDYSDSMYYTAKVIYPIRDVIMNEGVLRLLSEMTSKVLLFMPGFKVLRFGSWEEDDKEHFFASNDTYEKYTYSYTSPYYHGVYGDWSDYTYSSYTTKNDTKEDKVIKVVEEDIKESNFLFSVIVDATSSFKAQSLVTEFIDDFYEYIVDEDMPYETLQEIDVNMWEFCFETSHDISRFISAPFNLGYMCDYDKVC